MWRKSRRKLNPKIEKIFLESLPIKNLNWGFECERVVRKKIMKYWKLSLLTLSQHASSLWASVLSQYSIFDVIQESRDFIGPFLKVMTRAEKESIRIIFDIHHVIKLPDTWQYKLTIFVRTFEFFFVKLIYYSIFVRHLQKNKWKFTIVKKGWQEFKKS